MSKKGEGERGRGGLTSAGFLWRLFLGLVVLLCWFLLDFLIASLDVEFFLWLIHLRGCRLNAFEHRSSAIPHMS